VTPKARSYAPRPRPSAPPSTCDVCGAALPPSAGRRRIVCSIACRRQRDYRERKVRRRESWIADWRRELERDEFTRDEVRSAIRKLRAEIRALRAPTVPADGAAHPIAPAA
jgi:predicted nucleic acid-binding Zn ribbon protein